MCVCLLYQCVCVLVYWCSCGSRVDCVSMVMNFHCCVGTVFHVNRIFSASSFLQHVFVFQYFGVKQFKPATFSVQLCLSLSFSPFSFPFYCFFVFFFCFPLFSFEHHAQFSRSEFIFKSQILFTHRIR